MRRFITVCFFFSSLAVFADPGDLDLSFGNKTGMATMTNFEITGIIQQSDGKLVTWGSKLPSGGDHINRYNADGSFDTSFYSGTCSVSFSQVIQQADGKLVGLEYNNDCVVGVQILSQGWSMVRFNLDGTLDGTFGLSGFIAIPTVTYNYAIFQQADGKLVVGGQGGIARYNPNGTIDTGFGINGFVTNLFTNAMMTPGNSTVGHIFQQGSGDLIVSGYVSGWNGSNNSTSVVARYLPNGTLDTTFAVSGLLYNSSGNWGYNWITMTSDEKILFPIMVNNGTNYTVTVTRYDSSGNVDASYGASAVSDTVVWPSGVVNWSALQPDGKLLFGGNTTIVVNGVNTSYLIFSRLTADGFLDGDFGVNGIFITNAIDPLNQDTLAALTTQSDGKIVASVLTTTTTNYLVRFLNDDNADNGDNAGDQLGTSVTTIDYNNDGVPDIISGAPGADVMSGATVLTQAGEIKIISGKDHTVLARLKGTVASQHFGTSIAAVPDQNADGIPDLIVGEPQQDRVTLYSGANGLLIKVLAQPPAGVLATGFGTTLAFGDVNNDGFADVVVGAPGANTVFVYDGSTVFAASNPAPLYTRIGSAGAFGAAIAVDTQHHLMVGSPRHAAINITGKSMTNGGIVEIFDGSSGSGAALTTLQGSTPGERFGSSVGSLTSNGNWVVGSSGYTGHILVRGKSKPLVNLGRVQLFSSADGSFQKSINGNASGDRFGSSVVAQHDIDGDGKSDVVVGAAYTNVRKPVNGKLTLLKTAGHVHMMSGAKDLGL